MSIITRLLNLIDYNGYKVELNIKGNREYKTIPSCIISTFGMVFIICFCYYFLRDFLSDNTVTVIYNLEENFIPVNNITSLPIIFSLKRPTGEKIEMNHTFEFKVRLYKINASRDENGRLKTFISMEDVPFEKCDRKKHLKGYESLFYIDVESFYCIPPNSRNLTIYGTYGDMLKGFSNLVFFVNKCDRKKSSCNETLVTEVFKEAYFRIAYPSYYIDRNNKTHPNQLKLQIGTYLMTETFNRRYNLFLEQCVYQTDQGLILKDSEKIEFTKFSYEMLDFEPDNKLDTEGSPYFGSIVIKNNPNVSFYQRSYYKLQYLLANIGGSIQAVNIFIKLISNYLVMNLFYVDFANSIFDFSEGMKNKVDINSSKLSLQLKPIQLKNPVVNVRNDSKRLVLSSTELICRRILCFKKSKNLITIERIKKFLNLNLSVESMMSNFYKIECLVSNLNNEALKQELESDFLILYRRGSDEVPDNAKNPEFMKESFKIKFQNKRFEIDCC